MPEKRFVRRRNSIPDQGSLVSEREQARLLNDPAVPTDSVHTESDHDERRTSGAAARSTGQTPREFIEDGKTA